MSKGQRPVKQFVITKSADRDRVPNIGGAWATVNQDVFSCRIRLPFDLKAGEELNFIAVTPNEPTEPTPIDQPNGRKAKPPTRSGPRPRPQRGEQPRGAA
jgi:hypothetical protein